MSKQNPLVLDEVSNSSPSERHGEIWPIMSTSKAFCGALLTSAAHDFFGENGVEATVREALKIAKEKYPDRAEKIDELVSALEKSKTADLKISALLNHTTGLSNNNSSYFESPRYEAPDQNSYFSEMKVDPALASKFNYSNNGYYLLEEVTNLTSQKGYYQEMQDRIISPLGLTSTKFLKEASAEERSKIGDPAFLTKDRENPFIVGGTYESTYPIRNLSAAAGGLVSSAKDLEKFFSEYSKMSLGLENKISADREISSLYQKHSASAGNTHHSLGIMLVEDGDKILVGHPGGHAGNSCEAFVRVAATMKDFRDGTIKDDQISSFEFEFRKKSALGGLLKNGTLFHVLENYFEEKISTLDEDAQREIRKKMIPDQTKKLTALGALPENFSAFQARIAQITEEAFFNYLKENGLTNEKGVVDDEKLKENYEANKEGFYDRILGEKYKTKIDEILKECEQEFGKSNESEKQGFVEKLGLEKKSDQQEKSFVERIRDDKTQGKSLGGSNEL